MNIRKQPTAVLLAILTLICIGQPLAQTKSPESYLPLGLQYEMTLKEVRTQLSAFVDYELETDSEDEIAYVTRDFSGEATTSLYLVFEENRLKELESSSKRMGESEAKEYRKQLKESTKQWKANGIETLEEHSEFELCTYRDDLSYITIHTMNYANGDIRVSITFNERKAFETKFSAEVMFKKKIEIEVDSLEFPVGRYRCTEFEAVLSTGEVVSSNKKYKHFNIDIVVTLLDKNYIWVDGQVSIQEDERTKRTIENTKELFEVVWTDEQKGELLMKFSSQDMSDIEGGIAVKFFVDGDILKMTYLYGGNHMAEIQTFRRIGN